ncbi:Ribosomal large subunit pseudouridine synthase D [Candidatus Karelsulcia muelleri]|uniref:Pseudouridine synthase n=1 Tax=Candidatus Karelsulcia muelleri TaxID=336810 RepID=A0A654M777_9FLAO|nr:23S rRNA pseudouridine synthase [Candidatus Karelsulcia muelleri str. Sulcia-ALF]ALP70262.1 Ribosomal large subunit pseudouridine synthase D [Candidatus Karelsulcia muelleri]QND78319.1 Ribosomal large subunit pseudouridine synthase D [Candidatus Karelsulcia muelleri]
MVYVNNILIKKNYIVKINDVIEIFLPEKKNIIPENLKINIFYEDEYVIIINKQSGLVVHPGKGNESMTLINGLHFYFLKKNFDNKIPILVHRIDKGTSGLILVAKDKNILEKISKQFYINHLKRKYITLVWGYIKNNKGTIICNIGRSLKNRIDMNVFPNGISGKFSITHYKVLERFKDVTLLKCTLETGRTHQIRVHLKYIGHPIINDKDYGCQKYIKSIEKFQALHAYYLEYIHPIYRKKNYFICPIPERIKFIIKNLRLFNGERSSIG